MRPSRAPYAVTVEVAGVVCRLVCRHPKPILWARQAHPAFVSTRTPRRRVTIVYEPRQRALRWTAPDTVADLPRASREGRSSIVRTAYYRARLDRGERRIVVRMAPGFPVDGLMRTLWAHLLGRRGGVLVRALRVVVGDSAYLLCGLLARERLRLSAACTKVDVFDGFVALVRRRGSYASFTTPFHGGTTSVARDRAAPVRSVCFLRPDAPTSPSRLGPAAAVAALAPELWVADRRPATVGSLLERSTRLVAAVPCYVTSNVPDLRALSRASSPA